MAAEYYHVPLTTKGTPLGREALLVIDPGSEDIPPLPKADLIISSRPDVYDPRGTISAYLKRENFRAKTNLVAFILWVQPQ